MKVERKIGLRDRRGEFGLGVTDNGWRGADCEGGYIARVAHAADG